MTASRYTVLAAFLMITHALAPAGAAQAPPPDREALAQEVMAASRAWSAAAQARDLDAVVAYWAEDALFLSPGVPAIRGRDAIREFVAASLDVPGFSIQWEPLEAHVSEAGDMAYLLERNRITFNDESGAPQVVHNKVITIWRREPDGAWRNVVDIWNEDPSPQE